MGIASPRLSRRVSRDFGSTDAVAPVLGALDGERVQAAVVLWAQGDLRRLHEGVALAHADWRDVLVRAGLADDDWRQRLDVELGAE